LKGLINAQPTGREDNERSVGRFVVKCPHCGDELLFSEDRGVHCDGCEDFHEYNDYYNANDNQQVPLSDSSDG
jgi:phage terminase large subunit GpA-like protein